MIEPRARAALAIAFIALSGLTACNNGGLAGLSLVPVATYTASNMISPGGHSERVIGDYHYAVRATGTTNTPRARVEKIAMARAAEIGVEQKQKFFKVQSVNHSVSCRDKRVTGRGDKIPSERRPLVDIDVVYAQQPLDPSYRSSSDTFKALSTELEAEVVPADAQQQAEAEVAQQCSG